MASKKRLPDQINRDRVRIAELKFKGYTDKEIASVIAEETGIALSRRQITYDMQRIREKWLKTQNDTYQALVARELERLDVTESALWRAMRESATDGRRLERTEISEGGTKDIKAVELSGANPAFFTQIIKVQEERRKLLGLYAPQLIGIKKEITVKGYRNVSPDDWDIIDGEFSEQKRIKG